MPRRDVVVIGASAGGLQALKEIVERLPASLQVCVLVVLHTRADANGILPRILGRAGKLPVSFANTGDRLRHGHVYVARPDHHLLVTADGLQVAHGPRENGFRPAIDPLFRTAARELGPRVVGIVLSGALSDGAYGLGVVKHEGGYAIVQDPEEALISSMPLSALNAVAVDEVLRASAIASAIERLAGDGELQERQKVMSKSRRLEPQLPSEQTAVAEMQQLFGPPSALTCPDCGGALWEVREDGVVRYQCHVGHQYGPDSLETEQRTQIDGALWKAVRVLEEHAELKTRMARRAAENGLVTVADGFVEGAKDAHEQAQRIRAALFGMNERVKPRPRDGNGRPDRTASAKPASGRKAGGRPGGAAHKRPRSRRR
jgi:two-component system, chemotaxis family, protein-glutamate methylesterase/glutaminase